MDIDELDIEEIQEDISALQADVEEIQEKLNAYLRGCPYECGLDNTVCHILKEQKTLNVSIQALVSLLCQKGLLEPESFKSLVESEMKGVNTSDNPSK